MPIIVQKSQKYLDLKERNVLRTNIVYDAHTKELINFAVIQLFIDTDEHTHEIIKHDFSHGCYNIHRNYLGHTNRIEKPEIPLSYGLYQHARNETRANWEERMIQFCIRYLPKELR